MLLTPSLIYESPVSSKITSSILWQVICLSNINRQIAVILYSKLYCTSLYFAVIDKMIYDRKSKLFLFSFKPIKNLSEIKGVGTISGEMNDGRVIEEKFDEVLIPSSI